jgi:voltage-gated potassium channel
VTGYFTVLALLGRRTWRACKNPELRVMMLLVLLMISIGTVFYRHIEGWSWIDSIYFSVITLATVSSGDLAPTTSLSKIFTAAYILVGFAILATFITAITDHHLHDTRLRLELAEKEHKIAKLEHFTSSDE